MEMDIYVEQKKYINFENMRMPQISQNPEKGA